jgi:hypothetical protein
MSTIAAARTGHDAHTGAAESLTDGYALAFRTSAVLLLAAAALMLAWLPRRNSQTAAK